MYKRSIDPATREEFWVEEAKKVHWFKFPSKILNTSDQYLHRWYEDGETNICYNAVDRHIDNGLGDQLALIWDCAYLNIVHKFTYKQVKEKVSKLAAIY